MRAYRVEPGAGAGATSPAPTLPDKPSIAVLPFDNLSGDPAQAYFSDGITEDMITELSRFRDLLVIARNSSFAFRGKPVGAVEVGRRLGVRFLLEGSVRKAGERVRITAQLIDAVTGAHLWAERYDRTLEDIFAVQDEVVATIAATLAGRIELAGTERAKRKPTQDLLAYDCLLRGMEHLAGHEEDANAKARAMFERAAGLDPGYALARAYLALTIYVEEEWFARARAWNGRWPSPARRWRSTARTVAASGSWVRSRSTPGSSSALTSTPSGRSRSTRTTRTRPYTGPTS